MAKAPTTRRPGAKRTAAGGTTATRYRMRVKDTTLDFSPEITIEEKFAVRHGTGMPWDAFQPDRTDKFGEDCLVVYWWVARRQNGEPQLPLAKHMREWPTGLTADDVDLEEITDDVTGDDDPGESAGG